MGQIASLYFIRRAFPRSCRAGQTELTTQPAGQPLTWPTEATSTAIWSKPEKTTTRSDALPATPTPPSIRSWQTRGGCRPAGWDGLLVSPRIANVHRSTGRQAAGTSLPRSGGVLSRRAASREHVPPGTYTPTRGFPHPEQVHAYPRLRRVKACHPAACISPPARAFSRHPRLGKPRTVQSPPAPLTAGFRRRLWRLARSCGRSGPQRGLRPVDAIRAHYAMSSHLPSLALCSTASQTRWVRSACFMSGWKAGPPSRLARKSAKLLMNVCS